jgi:hypothetical protein
MRPIDEDFTDSISQHSTRSYFDKDARASLIECLHLRHELHRLHQVFDQQMGNGFRRLGIWRSCGIREDRDPRRAQLQGREKLRQWLLRRHHQRRVEGAGDGDLPGTLSLRAELCHGRFNRGTSP